MHHVPVERLYTLILYIVFYLTRIRKYFRKVINKVIYEFLWIEIISKLKKLIIQVRNKLLMKEYLIFLQWLYKFILQTMKI